MSWSAVVGHSEAISNLRAALDAGRLHPALLFEGPVGVGKRLVAMTLARALHCPSAPGRGGDPCGTCRVCHQIAASADPARTEENQTEHAGVRFLTPSRPDEREARFGASTTRGEVRSQITVSQIRALLAQSTARGRSRAPRLIVIDPADLMNDSAANALLKTLEEPLEGECFVLVTSRPSALLPTIRSRCVRIRFSPLSRDEVRRALTDRTAGLPAAPGALSDSDLDLAASLSAGSVGRARRLAEGKALSRFRETRGVLLEALEALDRGLHTGTFAVVAAASLRAREREEWIEGIGVLETLLRDIAVLSAGGAPRLANIDLADRLRPLAATIGGRAARALVTLDSVRSDLRLNVNGRLAAERILLEMGS